MSELLKKSEQTGGTEKESEYRTTQVFIEHATDKSRKQERERNQNTQPSQIIPLLLEKDF